MPPVPSLRDSRWGRVNGAPRVKDIYMDASSLQGLRTFPVSR